MAKKLLLLWLFSLGLLGTIPLYAYDNVENPVSSSTECTAPPPDSFRVTYKSTNEIALAWKSAWPGATQVLNVFVKNDLNDWDNVHSNLLVQGESHVFTNLISGRTYAFDIATRCSGTGGEHGDIVRVIDGALIIDLTLQGRTPVNPTSVDCTYIPKNAEWKGFVVSGPTKEGYVSSYFELTNCEVNGLASPNKACIKRADHDNPIVATNQNSWWPFGQTKFVGTISPFRMGLRDMIFPNTKTIGWVLFGETQSHFFACPYYDHPEEPWNTEYIISPLIAHSAGFNHEEENTEERFPLTDSPGHNIKVQTPFSNELRIFLPQKTIYDGIINCSIVDSGGSLVCFHRFNAENQQVIIISTNDLKSGFHILKIETPTKTETIKILKL